MPALTICAREPGSRARAGILQTAHGAVRTPAFVPLATKGSVRGLSAAEVAALGYEMVLGNTFHLFLSPGEQLVAELGGLHEFMRWPGPVITDSGGFQVFSLGHGTVADEIKGRGSSGSGAILAIEEQGVHFRSPIDGAKRFMGPEDSMRVQRALGSDLVLAFDECTPFHVDRAYTQASTERTHRWLGRCIDWRSAQPPDGSLFYGIVQGGVYEDLRIESAAAIAGSACEGIAIGGSLGAEKPQMYEVVDWTCGQLERLAPARPRHLLGIGEVDDLIRGVELGIDTFDCAMPTRLARHGTALVADPAARWRLALDRPASRRSAAPIIDGCPCPACSAGYSRAYLHHLFRTGELTGARLLTSHNLVFIAALMRRLRAAIERGRLREVAAELRSGAAPF
ncbi:MAG: tRNA guanosine(34) transglycosylase Tgt [Solirubrobacteraceae bacterium]